ncbi:MAG TPA: hypothetical protein VJ024_09370 [Thermodesulfovibrionales bacterium]|nr:hypothetical protein [Thermodesulfovibrionales bacterium]
MKLNLLITSLILLLVGCSVGRDFVRPEQSSLLLGKTAHDKIIELFGSPYSKGIKVVNDKNLITVCYAYAKASGKTLYKGVNPGKAICFDFYNDYLVGYSFISSFKTDNTNFDESRISLIKKDRTTKNEVIEILGEPSGISIYPITKNENETEFYYVYAHERTSKVSKNKSNIFLKELNILLNEYNVVSEIKSNILGEP